MNSFRARYCLLMILLSVFFTGCGSSPAPVPALKENGEESTLPRSVEITTPRDSLEEVRRLVVFGSLETLEEAIEKLRNHPDRASTRARELAFLAERLKDELYSEGFGDSGNPSTPEPSLPEGSPYPGLFAIAQNGELPVIPPPGASDDFFRYIIPVFTILYSDDEDIYTSLLESISSAEELLEDAALTSVLPPLLRGIIAEKRGDWSPALGFYRTAEKLDSSCYPASIRSAKLQVLRRNPGEAKKNADTAARYAGESSSDISAVRGGIQFIEGEVKAAADRISRLLNNNPRDYFLLSLRAWIFLGQNNYSQAVTLSDAAVEEGGWNSRLFSIQAEAYIKMGNYGDAEKVLSEGARRYPANTELKELYGKTLLHLGRTGEGRELLTSLLEQQPGNSSILSALFEDAYENKDWQNAAGYLEDLLPLAENRENLEKAYRVYTELKDEDKSFSTARALYALSDDSPDAAIPYAEELLRRGNLEEANSVLEKLLNDSAIPRKLKSRLYYLRSMAAGGEAQKERFLQKALFEDLENLDALVSLAELNRKRGDFRKAYQYIKQASSIAPERDDIREKVQEYERLIN